MADDHESDVPDLRWTVRLREVERLEPSEGDEGEDYFATEFELSGPGVSGSLTAMVTDPADENTIVAEAYGMLLSGLQRYTEVLRRRKGSEPANDA